MGYPVVPLLFLLASVAMLVNSAVEQPLDTAFSFGVILAGIPAFYIWRALRRREAVA